MGYYSHEVSIVIACDYDGTDELVAEFDCWVAELNREYSANRRLFGLGDFPPPDNHIITKSERMINGFYTYVFNVDGGKEGHRLSNICDELREEFFLRAREAGLTIGGTVRFPEDGPSFWTPMRRL